VVATDVSATALARAAERAAGAAIVWVRDDITDSRLHGEFDVILDRGCLHLLDPDRALAYASAMTRLLAPDGVLLLKTHAPSEGDARATTPYDRASIERLLGHAFVLEADDASTFPGPREAPAARLFVLRRHG
jgi:SAM-dependent methyltransferase